MSGAHPDGDERHRVARIYSRYARSARRRRSWSAENPGNVAIREELVQAALRLAADPLQAWPRVSVLDIGCGTGWWLEQLASRVPPGAVLHGLELLNQRAAAARDRVPAATITTGDARALPYGDGRFDVVTLFTVLSSLADELAARVALREARRVLAPGGVLLVWEPRVVNPLNRATILIRARMLSAELTDCRLQTISTTVLPPLARRVGGPAYRRLARVPALRTHRLLAARAPGALPTPPAS